MFNEKVKYAFATIVSLLVILVLIVYTSYRGFLNSTIDNSIQIDIKAGSSKVQVLNEVDNQIGLTAFQMLSSKAFLYLNPSVTFDAGFYRFQEGTTFKDLYTSIKQGIPKQTELTFLEGWRTEQNSYYLRTQVGSNFALNYHRLSQGKEGYLYPDTYYVDSTTEPSDLVAKQQEQFERLVEPLLANYSGNLSKKELITFASIVEREVRKPEDRKIVAGILIKRYQEGMPLDADATTQYAKGSINIQNFNNCLMNTDCSLKEEEFWPSRITQADLKKSDGYNTRGKVGLPRTPICNPSLSSFEAVVNPTETNYYYYLNDSEGTTYYSETLEEHNIKVNTYL